MRPIENSQLRNFSHEHIELTLSVKPNSGNDEKYFPNGRENMKNISQMEQINNVLMIQDDECF